MRTLLYRHGQMIYFRLDGNVKGEGRFISYSEMAELDGKLQLEVCLTAPCKEYVAGDKIFIDDAEVY